MNEVKGRLTWWKAWAHHDAADYGSHERERGAYMLALIMLPDGPTHDEHF